MHDLKIGIKGLKVDCVIGIYPKERELEQSLYIDLEVTPLNIAGDDDIAATINYESLAEICMNTAKEKKCKLIEVLAKEILVTIFLKISAVSNAKISINKPSAIKDALSAYVTIYKERQ